MEQFCTNIEDFLKSLKTASFNYLDGLAAKEQIDRIKNFKVIKFNEKVCLPNKEDTLKYKNIKVTKRSDGRFQARFLVDGKYKYIYDKNQKMCYEKLKDAFVETKPILKPQKFKLIDWIETWLTVYKKPKVKANTFHHINCEINKYLLNSFAQKEITKITPIEIETLLNNIKAERQREKIYTHLKDMFDKALKNKIIKENVLQNVEKPKHTKKVTKAFTREEQKKFIEECSNNKYKDFFLILLYEGLRCGELLALEGKDIDLKNNKITINKTLNDLGKISTPKTKSSYREIPIFENAKPILEKYVHTNERIFNVTHSPIFDAFKSITNKLKLNDFTVHSLRHTFITRWTENGAPSKLIQKWVGHSTNIITEKVYTKINNDFEQSFIKEKQRNFDTDFDTDF